MQPKPTSRPWLIASGLLLLTLVVYAPVVWCGFVEIDDFGYVYQNARITAGLKLQNILYYWTHGLGGNWHPITAISHMLDCQLFGLNARWHHVENVLFHAANVVLLFFLLQRFGDKKQTLVPAWIITALFAVHPLHVESVAWISERKDVLSAFFFLLALHAYLTYAQNKTKRPYWLCLVWFICGVLSKPMVVTLPCVLLLLDFWPLQRTGWKTLLIEKWPFCAVSIIDSIFTVLTQHSAGAIVDVHQLTFTGKLAYIAQGYWFYLEKFFAPTDLAVFYAPAQHPSQTATIVLLLVIFAISAVAIALRRRQPSTFTGWFWFIGMLVPVIGLVQVGNQAYADRYSYLPSIGLSLALIWPLVHFSKRRSLVAVAATTCALAALISICQTQILFWQNAETLYTRVITVRPNDRESLVHYAGHFEEIGLIDKAAHYYTNALTIEPDGYALFHLGKIYSRKHDLDSAQRCFEAALKYAPDRPEVNHALGRLHSDRDNSEQALQYFARSITGHTDYADGLRDYAWTVAIDPHISATNAPLAVQYAQKLVSLEPTNAINLAVLAGAQARAGHFPEAIQSEQKAIKLAEASGLAGVAARCRKHLSQFQKGEMAKD